MQDGNAASEPKPQQLLDRVRSDIRLRHYSPRTEEAYVGWIRRFVIFHRKRHPREMGDAEVRQFLTDLAEKQREAVQMAYNEKVSILTGGPGTGKSTSIRALIMLLRTRKIDVALAAPTGRAAKG